MRMSALSRQRSGAFRPVGIVSKRGLPSVKFIYACICRRKFNKIKRCSPQLRTGKPKSSAMANTFVRFIFYSRVSLCVKRKAYKKHDFRNLHKKHPAAFGILSISHQIFKKKKSAAVSLDKAGCDGYNAKCKQQRRCGHKVRSACFVLFSLFAIKINICKERTIHEHNECSRAVRQHGV